MIMITITDDKPENVVAFYEWLQANGFYPSGVERRVYDNGAQDVLLRFAVTVSPYKDLNAYDVCVKEIRRRVRKGLL